MYPCILIYTPFALCKESNIDNHLIKHLQYLPVGILKVYVTKCISIVLRLLGVGWSMHEFHGCCVMSVAAPPKHER